MTVLNSTFSSSNDAFQPGTGKLTISKFFGGDSIVIQLSRVTLPRTQSMRLNILEYSGDTNLVFASCLQVTLQLELMVPHRPDI